MLEEILASGFEALELNVDPQAIARMRRYVQCMRNVWSVYYRDTQA